MALFKRWLLLPLAIVAGSAEASTRRATTEQMCQAADVVVIGRVFSMASQWSNTPDGHIITSMVTFEVERVVHGQSRSSVQVFALGGRLGSESVEVGGTPLFNLDERYLLLLHNRLGQAPTIVAAGQGALRLDGEVNLPSAAALTDIWEENCG